VAFVFISFYVTRLLLNHRVALGRGRTSVRLAEALATSLFAVVCAEVFRWCITRNGLTGDQLNWYFGTARDRISFDTFHQMGHYFRTAFAFTWLAVAALIVLAVYILLKRWEGVKLLLPFGVGFMSGWLVFTRLYADHDYYGLPTMFMLFAAVSIAAREIGSRFSKGDEWPTVVVISLVVAVPLLVIYGHKSSVYGVTSEGVAMRFMLRDVDNFMYVSDQSGYPSPEPGGLTGKPFTTIDPSELRSSCTDILEHAHAVVVRRKNADTPMPCLAMARESAQSYLVGPVYQVFLLRN
jgi:hypothetical protein